MLSLVDAESHAPIIMKQCPAARGFKKGYIQIELLFSALAVRKLKSRAEWKVWNNIKAELLIKTYIKEKEWNKIKFYVTIQCNAGAMLSGLNKSENIILLNIIVLNEHYLGVLGFHYKSIQVTEKPLKVERPKGKL